MRAPSVAWLGLLVAFSALTVSVVGIVWSIDPLSVTFCLVASLIASVVVGRRFPLRPAMSWPHLALLLPLVVAPALVALVPPHAWDEVAYGAALPRDYARTGHFFYNADYGPYSAFPANYGALATAALVLNGSMIPVKLLNVVMALGLGVLGVHLARRLGVPERIAPVAAVFVLAAASLPGATMIVKNDVANAFFQGLALLALAEYAVHRDAGRLALGGFFIGMALGTKYSSLHFALCVVPLTGVLVFLRTRSSSVWLRSMIVFSAVLVVAALPWYARNSALFGNPFFPFFNDILGADNAFTAEHAVLTREMFEGIVGFGWKQRR